MALDDGTRQVRVAGHGYSLWLWNNIPLGYAVNITHTSPSPVSPPADIQPINHIRPVEIVTGRAVGSGQLTMTVIELYRTLPWDHLEGTFPKGLNDLADVMHYFRANSTEFGSNAPQFVKVIRPPMGGQPSVEEYKNIRILDIREDEDVSIDTTTNQFVITIGYTHKVKRNTDEGPGRNREDIGAPINSRIY